MNVFHRCLPSLKWDTLSWGFSCLLFSRQKCWARIVDELQRHRARDADRRLRNSRGEGKPHSLRITLVKIGKRLPLKWVKTLIFMLSFQQDDYFLLTKKTQKHSLCILFRLSLFKLYCVSTVPTAQFTKIPSVHLKAMADDICNAIELVMISLVEILK